MKFLGISLPRRYTNIASGSGKKRPAVARSTKIKEMKTELNDFRYNAGMAAIVDSTSKELTTAPPLELPHEDRVKVAKFLMEAQVAPDNDVLADCFRQALRVLIQHKMDFGIFILGKAIVENSRGEPSRDDDDHEDSNGGS